MVHKKVKSSNSSYDNQKFTYDTNLKQFKSIKKGYCIDNGGEIGSKLNLQKCDANAGTNQNQLFRPTPLISSDLYQQRVKEVEAARARAQPPK